MAHVIRRAAWTGALVLTLTGQAALAGPTLDAIKLRGEVVCGVSTNKAGFSMRDRDGKWSGIDVDLCRAVAAGVLGQADKVSFSPLSSQERFKALQSGEIDLLSRNTTWTYVRDTSLGVAFVGINYYDGQGFMVKKELKAEKLEDLNNARICVQSGSTSELNLADVFASKGLKYTPVLHDSAELTGLAFQGGRCTVLTGDKSELHGLRLGLTHPDSAVVLPMVISKEPLGPVVRRGDEQWQNIVRWTLFAMIQAEELGITSENIDQMKTSNNPEIKRMLTNAGDLGLPLDWVSRVIKQVGNYGEVFERNVGRKSPLAIARGPNDLWSRGGLHYAPPFR